MDKHTKGQHLLIAHHVMRPLHHRISSQHKEHARATQRRACAKKTIFSFDNNNSYFVISTCDICMCGRNKQWHKKRRGAQVWSSLSLIALISVSSHHIERHPTSISKYLPISTKVFIYRNFCMGRKLHFQLLIFGNSKTSKNS